MISLCIMLNHYTLIMYNAKPLHIDYVTYEKDNSKNKVVVTEYLDYFNQIKDKYLKLIK